MGIPIQRVVGLALGVVLFTWSPPGGTKQPRFGVELEGGVSSEFHPYIQNEVVTSRIGPDDSPPPGEFRPYLADRYATASPAFSFRLVAKSLTGHIQFRWFNLDQREFHHRGDSTLPIERLRPDGTVDDAGINYSPLANRQTTQLDPGVSSTLYQVALGGGYRFIWPGKAYDLFVPVHGSLVWIRSSSSAAPTRLGLEAAFGGGISVQLGQDLAMNLTGKLHGLTTRHYGRSQDAAYRAVQMGDSTESAFFSSQVFATFNIALQFAVR